MTTPQFGCRPEMASMQGRCDDTKTRRISFLAKAITCRVNLHGPSMCRVSTRRQQPVWGWALTLRTALIIACLGIFSCSTPTRYYMLDTLNMRNGPISEPDNRNAEIIGLEPIDLPSYVDQIRLVRRTGSNTLAVSPHDQWNEPLDAGVRRVIASNLTYLMPDTKVEYAPLPRDVNADYGLTIEISRFDASADGAVLLEGEWSLVHAGDSGVDKRQSYRFQIPSQGDSHADIAANMSNALAALARDIAKAFEP